MRITDIEFIESDSDDDSDDGIESRSVVPAGRFTFSDTSLRFCLRLSTF